MIRTVYVSGAIFAAAIMMAACTHSAVEDEAVVAEPVAVAPELPTLYYAMTDIYQPEFQGVADTAFWAYDDDGNLDSSLLTDEQWATMKASAEVLRDTSRAFAVAETIRVAEDGEELFNEGQGFIASEDVQAIIDAEPDGFKAMMTYLADEAERTLDAIEARDAEALSLSSDNLYAACKTCHTVYWYPGRR